LRIDLQLCDGKNLWNVYAFGLERKRLGMTDDKYDEYEDELIHDICKCNKE